MFKEFKFSKEQGLDVDPHIHAFIRTHEKMLFNKLRLFFRRFKVEGKCILRDLKPCKSAKSYMRYITKEDYNAVVFKLGRRGGLILILLTNNLPVAGVHSVLPYTWAFQVKLV